MEGEEKEKVKVPTFSPLVPPSRSSSVSEREDRLSDLVDEINLLSGEVESKQLSKTQAATQSASLAVRTKVASSALLKTPQKAAVVSSLAKKESLSTGRKSLPAGSKTAPITSKSTTSVPKTLSSPSSTVPVGRYHFLGLTNIRSRPTSTASRLPAKSRPPFAGSGAPSSSSSSSASWNPPSASAKPSSYLTPGSKSQTKASALIGDHETSQRLSSFDEFLKESPFTISPNTPEHASVSPTSITPLSDHYTSPFSSSSSSSSLSSLSPGGFHQNNGSSANVHQLGEDDLNLVSSSSSLQKALGGGFSDPDLLQGFSIAARLSPSVNGATFASSSDSRNHFSQPAHFDGFSDLLSGNDESSNENGELDEDDGEEYLFFENDRTESATKRLQGKSISAYVQEILRLEGDLKSKNYQLRGLHHQTSKLEKALHKKQVCFRFSFWI